MSACDKYLSKHQGEAFYAAGPLAKEFNRDVNDRAVLHQELRRMALSVGARLTRDGLAARTVTTKVRYPDFAIRSRSQTSPVGIDDAERIGELACALLDRALADRPGALRLVGVGVSGLEDHRQLALLR